MKHFDNSYQLVYICENDLTQQVGGTIHVQEILKALSQHQADILLIAPDYHHDGKLDEKFHPYQRILIKTPKVRILKWLYFYIKSSWIIFQHYQKNKNIVIYSREMLYNVVLTLFLKLRAIPYFIEVNGLLIEEMKDLGYHRFLRRLALFFEKFNLKSANQIISVSEGIKSELVHRLSIPSDRIQVIPNGTDLETFYPRNQQICRQSLAIDAEQYIIGFTGSCYPYHDINTLIRAMPELIKRIPEIHLFIVGDGYMLKQWKNLAIQYAVQDKITFTGYVNYDKINQYINTFDICFASYTQNTYGFPMKLLDYMACNKAVITSKVKAITSYFKATPSFRFITAKDKNQLTDTILALYQSRNSRVTSHRKFIQKNYTWQQTAQKILKTINQVCAE